MHGVDVGNLQHRVRVQQIATAQDAFGQPGATWTDVFTQWASVEDLTGRELEAAQAIQAEVSTRITMRWRNGVNPQMRAVWGTKIYNILAVLDPTGRHRVMYLMCERGKSDVADSATTPDSFDAILLEDGGNLLNG